MPDAPASSARQRFARDLRRIREHREVSLASVHAATQIPEPHLESFEDGRLFEESTMTDVYLKAFVQAYADAIGVSPDSVVDHLRSALEGTYQHELADTYLDVPDSETAGEAAGSTDEESVDAQLDREPLSRDEAEAAFQEEDNEEESDEGADAAENESLEASTGETALSPAAAEDTDLPESDPADEGKDHSSVGSITDPSAAGGPSSPRPSRSSASSRSFWDEHRRMILGGIAVLVVLAGIAGVVPLFFSGEPSTPSTPSPDATPPSQTADPSMADSVVTASTDTSAAEPPPTRPPASIVLGDTLYVTVLASAPVRELRVQQDEDLRRPYWIEEGAARVFPFTRRITLQNQLDSARLLLQRYPYPTTRTDAQGRVVITRDTATQFADTLRGAPVVIPGPVDTVQIAAPPPADTLPPAPPADTAEGSSE